MEKHRRATAVHHQNYGQLSGRSRSDSDDPAHLADWVTSDISRQGDGYRVSQEVKHCSSPH